MVFEVFRKKDNNYSYVDGIVNMLPYEVLSNPNFNAWRKSVALTKDIFETNNHIVTLKS